MVVNQVLGEVECFAWDLCQIGHDQAFEGLPGQKNGD